MAILGISSLPSEVQVRLRMEIIRPYTQWVRSFSTTEAQPIHAGIKVFGIQGFKII
ncbi:MAG: hypothetical protein AAFQ98_17610 [Bacteroidota bacterium]